MSELNPWSRRYRQAALSLLILSSHRLALAQGEDPVKGSIQRYLDAFQGQVGDWIVISGLLLLCLAVYRRSFKSAAGCLFLIAGVVFLRISISILF